jgi:hypothetical protein
VGEIESDEQAQKLNDYITGCRKLFKQIEDQRKIDKQPHLDAGKLVDTTYKALTAPLAKAADRVKPLLTRWSIKLAEAERERQCKVQEAARAEQEAARKLAEEAAARNDVAGEAEAEQAQKDADKAAKQAARTSTTGRVASATGGGRTAALRTYYSATVTSRRQAFLALEAEHGGAFDDLICRIADAAKRADRETEIPGVKFTEEKRIA